jgi:hypothetical protein
MFSKSLQPSLKPRTWRSDSAFTKKRRLHLPHEIRLICRYKQGTTLAGVLYFHRISDVRMGGISTRNFRVFRRFCGENALRNVVIVTNRWGEIDPQVGNEREAELTERDVFFKPVLGQGARIARHHNTIPSAEQIIRLLLNNHPTPLRIQEELVNQGKNITETSAGEELNRELNAQIRRCQQEPKEDSIAPPYVEPPWTPEVIVPVQYQMVAFLYFVKEKRNSCLLSMGEVTQKYTSCMCFIVFTLVISVTYASHIPNPTPYHSAKIYRPLISVMGQTGSGMSTVCLSQLGGTLPRKLTPSPPRPCHHMNSS